MENTFTKATDEEHKIKVESSLLYAIWKCSVARGGNEAKLEVRTAFVGQGADIEIIAKGDDYGKIEKKKDKIFNNRYEGSIAIPDDVLPGELVWFEVKLSKQKLKGSSNSIPAAATPILTRMGWDKKEARRGDVLRLQAELEQVADNAEAFVVIYEYDKDGTHDKIATIPTEVKNRKIDVKWEYEYHEDVDEIPTDEEMKKYGKKYNPPEYFFVVVIDGVTLGEEQESGILEFKDWIEIELKEEDGTPVEDKKISVILPDGKDINKTTDENGYIKIENIPPGKFEVNYSDEDTTN